jgi:hypothetical protein
MATTLTPSQAERARQQWILLVGQLINQIETWSKDRNWSVDRQEKEIHESRLGDYTVPVLRVLAPAGEIHIEPVARDVAKADGRVDLYSFPSFNRMLIVRIGERWVLKTDAGVEWPEKWSQKTFVRLADLLNQ